jgi:hypothetical protein
MTARIFETQVSGVRALGLDGLFGAAGQGFEPQRPDPKLGVKRGTLNGLEGAVKHSTSDAPIRPVRFNE